jgi:hypothetical protein
MRSSSYSLLIYLNLRSHCRLKDGICAICPKVSDGAMQSRPDSQYNVHAGKIVHAGCRLLAPLRSDCILRARRPLRGTACEPFRTL